MLRLLRWLITGDGHLHEWEKSALYQNETTRGNGSRVVRYTHVLQCKRCGNLKKFTV